MKNIFILLFFLIPFLVHSQTKTWIPLSTPSNIMEARNGFQADSVIYMPYNDTTFTPYRNGAIIFRLADGMIYRFVSSPGNKQWYCIAINSYASVRDTITQTAGGFVIGNTVSKTSTNWVLGDTISNYFDGVVSKVIDANTFEITITGKMAWTSGLPVGAIEYQSTQAGAITATSPVISVPVGKQISTGIFYVMPKRAVDFSGTSTGAVTSVNGQTGVVNTKSADSLKGWPVDTTLNRNGYLLAKDSVNKKWVMVAPSTAGSLTLQQTFNLESGGSSLTKNDTILMSVNKILRIKNGLFVTDSLVNGLDHRQGLAAAEFSGGLWADKFVTNLNSAAGTNSIIELKGLNFNASSGNPFQIGFQNGGANLTKVGWIGNGNSTDGIQYMAFGMNGANTLGATTAYNGWEQLVDIRSGVAAWRVLTHPIGTVTETTSFGMDYDGTFMIGGSTNVHKGAFQVNGKSWFSDTVSYDARVSYSKNLGSTFTDYSHIDKHYGDSSRLSNAKKGISTITTSTTLDFTYHTILVDATGGNITITLPAASTGYASGYGIEYVIQKIDASANTVTVQRAGSDTINGSTSFTISTQYSTKIIQAASSSTWTQF